ncbi:unnamed protein product [Sphenostylis stenocarpa]|uniref:Uncharacterized protein n=1 Tax=Sphenostylis stenocarpa TaxID=92480 RepID=A0AA86RUC3_9FABA|nr:unnamed protein product [Sphenostylis stenocarpa]
MHMVVVVADLKVSDSQVEELEEMVSKLAQFQTNIIVLESCLLITGSLKEPHWLPPPMFSTFKWQEKGHGVICDQMYWLQREDFFLFEVDKYDCVSNPCDSSSLGFEPTIVKYKFIH